MDTPQKQDIALIEETLKDLESSKVNISSSIKKLRRAAVLLNEEDVIIWCEIQLRNSKYTRG
jgi:hypothetical protein